MQTQVDAQTLSRGKEPEIRIWTLSHGLGGTRVIWVRQEALQSRVLRCSEAQTGHSQGGMVPTCTEGAGGELTRKKESRDTPSPSRSRLAAASPDPRVVHIKFERCCLETP